MPSARLITDSIDEAQDLAADLRNRGFAVEIVSPDHVPLQRVDLEVRLEESPTEQALRSAEELSQTEDIHVFIAPGAIVESLRPMISVPLELASVEREMPASAALEDSLASVESAHEVGDFALPGDENAFAQPVAEAEETFVQPEIDAQEFTKVFSPSSEMQSLEIFAKDQQVTAEVPQSDEISVQEQISVPQEESPVPVLEMPVEQSPAYALQSQDAKPPVSESQVEDIFSQGEPAIEISSSDAPALGKQVFAQEEEGSLPVGETTVEQVPSYAMETHEAFPPSDWPIWQPLAESDEPELASVSAPAASIARRPPTSVGTFTRARNNNDRLFWRLAIVASVVAVSTMLLGVSAHRFSPIPRGLAADDGSLPFKSKTAPATSQTEGDAVAQVVPATSTPEFKQVTVHMPVADRPSPAEHLGSRVEHPKRYQRAVTRREDDTVAKDTVVRFGKKPVTPRMEASKKSGIKHYSDLR